MRTDCARSSTGTDTDRYTYVPVLNVHVSSTSLHVVATGSYVARSTGSYRWLDLHVDLHVDLVYIHLGTGTCVK